MIKEETLYKEAEKLHWSLGDGRWPTEQKASASLPGLGGDQRRILLWQGNNFGVTHQGPVERIGQSGGECSGQ